MSCVYVRQLPGFNKIDPIGDAGQLGKLVDPGNLFPFVTIVGILVGLTTGALITGFLDRWEQAPHGSTR